MFFLKMYVMQMACFPDFNTKIVKQCLVSTGAIFHGARIYGVFMGVFKFMPHKKNHEFSVNGWIFMKNEMAFDDIFITHELYPWLTFHGKDRDMATMKI